MQRRPVEYADLLSFQFHAACQHFREFVLLGALAQGPRQLYNSTPFTRLRILARVGDKMGVVLATHGSGAYAPLPDPGCELLHITPMPERLLSRYRPPQPQSSKYITLAGEAHLRTELEQLWRIERPRVTQAVATAAAQGDRSENADYTYGKRRLREIDARVRHLRKRLEGMVVVNQPPSDPKRVFFGAYVTVETADGDRHRYRILGPDEFADEPGGISMDAPLARALLGKPLDAEVTVTLAGGDQSYVIVEIVYLPTDE